jgi:hypothetical protein
MNMTDYIVEVEINTGNTTFREIYVQAPDVDTAIEMAFDQLSEEFKNQTAFFTRRRVWRAIEIIKFSQFRSA